MSLDIGVYNPSTHAQMEMNWLRNPYGLEPWARRNYLYATQQQEEPKPDLWDVLNQWNYDKSIEVDKSVFLATVMLYGDVIFTLKRGYFWFDEGMFKQFVKPCMSVLPHAPGYFLWAGSPALTGIKDTVEYTFWKKPHVGIPMEYFGHACFELSDAFRPHAHTLAHYQDWYKELTSFAELLQKPDSIFSCSN